MTGKALATRCAIAALALVCSTTAGCATYSAVKSPFTHRAAQLRIDLPQGWLRYNPANPALTMTRDGLRLERITVALTHLGKKLPDTQRVFHENMLPHELAMFSLGLIEARDDTVNFEIEKIELAAIAGRDAYLAHARYADDGGLPKRLKMYGTIIGDYVCEFAYEAAELVYFDKYDKIFEDLVASAKMAEN